MSTDILSRTDVGILIFLPIPLLWTVKASLSKKITMGVVLCSCGFLIVAALLRVIYALGSLDDDRKGGMWATRESFVGILVVSAPGIKPLFVRRKREKLQATSATSKIETQSVFKKESRGSEQSV